MSAEKVIKNLRLNNSQKILIVNGPEEFKAMLKGITYDTEHSEQNEGNYDFVQVFASKQVELEELLKETQHKGKYDCLFWACYPKKSGGIKSDIKRETVWGAVEPIGLSTVTAVSIDGTWSALRVRPVEVVGK